MKKQITIERLQSLQESISYLDNFGTIHKSINVSSSQEDLDYRDIDIIYNPEEISFLLTQKLHKLAELNIQRKQIINELMNFNQKKGK
jgi:hypothetical protein